MNNFQKALKTGKGLWLGGFAALAMLSGCLTSTDKGGNTNTAPSITTQPQPASVVLGATATFSVTATGSGTLTYQWQRNGVNITGATSASYTTPATVAGDDGAQFRCVVSNSAGPTTSSAATLQVSLSMPAITVQPQDDLVLEGGDATFSITATGSGTLSYQWQGNGQDLADIAGFISGTATSTLTITGVVASDGGVEFTCVVSNSGGADTSDAAYLLIDAPVSVLSVNAGAQDNLNSFLDIDDMTDYTETEITAIGNDDGIDLFYGWSTSLDTSVIYSPDVARYGVGGAGGGFTIAQSLDPANYTDIRPASLTLAEFNAISNKSEIDALWAMSFTDSDGRLPVAVGDTFMARSDVGLIVLIRVTALVRDTNGSINLDGVTRF